MDRKKQNVIAWILVGVIITLLVIIIIFAVDKAIKNNKNKTTTNGAKGFLSDRDNMSVLDTGKDGDQKYVLSAEIVQETISPVSELVSLKYEYKDAANYKKSGKIQIFKGITTEEVVYTYRGTILAGIDFSQIGIEVDNDNMKIKITLPKPHIISNELDMDSFETYDVKTSVFTKISMKNVTDQLDVLKKNMAEEFESRGEYQKTVTENAKLLIKSFLGLSELTKEYDIEFVEQ